MSRVPNTKMVTAVVYYEGKVTEITSYTSGSLPLGCENNFPHEIHYWTTKVNKVPTMGSKCMCGNKKYHGHDEG